MGKGKPKSFKRFARRLPEEIKRRKRAQKYKSRVAERQHKKDKRKLVEEKEKAQTAAADKEFDEKANKDELEALKMVSGKTTFEGLVADIPLDTPIETVPEEEEIPFSESETKEIRALFTEISKLKTPSCQDQPTKEEMLAFSKTATQTRKINELFSLRSESGAAVSNSSNTVFINSKAIDLIGKKASTSMAALRLLTALYRHACDYDSATAPLSICGGLYSCDFSGGDAVESALAYGLAHGSRLFEGHLGIPTTLAGEERWGRVVQLLRSRSKVWNAGIALLSRIFLRASVRMLRKVSHLGLKIRVVNELYKYVPFFAQFPVIANLYADVLAQYVAEGNNNNVNSADTVDDDVIEEDDDVSISGSEELGDKASNTILGIAQACIVSSTFIGDAIRLLYRHCVRVSTEHMTSSSVRRRNVTALSIAKECMTALFGMNYNVSYKVAFPYIRMLTLYIRGAILRNDETDSGALVRSWPIIDSACMWGSVLSTHAPVSDHLKNFIFPVVQALFNIIDFCPLSSHIAIRLLCVDVINELSFKTQTFSNTLPALLQCLGHKELKADLDSDRGRYNEPLGPVLHISRQKLASRAVQKELFDHIYAGLLEFLAHYSRSIAFPEIAVPALVALKKYKLECMNLFFCKRMGYFIGKVKANYDWVVSRRNRIDFTPKDIDAAKEFLSDDKAKSPLSVEWKKFEKKYGSVFNEEEEEEENEEVMENDKGTMIEQNEDDEEEIAEGFEDEFDEEDEDEEDDMMIMNDEFDDIEDDEEEEEEEEEEIKMAPKRKKSKRN